MQINEHGKMLEIEGYTEVNYFLNLIAMLFIAIGGISIFVGIVLAMRSVFGMASFEWITMLISSGLYCLALGAIIKGIALIEKHVRVLVKFRLLEKQIEQAGK